VTTQTTRLIPAVGIGFPDYSRGISTQTVPLIRSADDQYAFSAWDSVLIADGASTIIDIPATPLISGVPTVVICYDFYSSMDADGLCMMVVQSVSAAPVVVSQVVRKLGYGLVEEHLAVGYPFQNIIRLTLQNRTGQARTFTYGVLGVWTSKQTFNLTSTPVP